MNPIKLASVDVVELLKVPPQKKGTPRTTITIPPDVKKWYDDSADEMGLTTNAFINLVLAQTMEATKQAIEHYHKNK
jgi:hypothetical protein